jgi:uncharacterized protein YbjQ (UPF0145 family)
VRRRRRPRQGEEDGVVDYSWTSTTFEMPGCHVVRNLGVVRGVTVRSAHLGSQIAAGFRSLGGGRIDEYVEMCEQARAEAFAIMVAHAEQMGANAIVGVRYDATELAQNMTEVLAYGSAVVVEGDAPKA